MFSFLLFNLKMLYRMSPKSYYKRSGGDFTCKNRLEKEKNITFLFKAPFSKRLSLKAHQVSCISWKFQIMKLLFLLVSVLLNMDNVTIC